VPKHLAAGYASLSEREMCFDGGTV